VRYFSAPLLQALRLLEVLWSAKCMIDEGYGRYTPCEALYKSKKCMIDKGNGRYTPCEALVRQRKAKKR
jgi:hypothetical protein